MNDLGVRREILVWRDRWFLKVHHDYAQLHKELIPKLEAALSALDDNHIARQLNELLRDVIFPMLDSFEGTKKRSILLNARAELHQIFEVATLHKRERSSLPALICADAKNPLVANAKDPWEEHPAYQEVLKPNIFERINTYTYAKKSRKAVIKIVNDLIFENGGPNLPSCKARVIGAIDLAAKEALSDA